MRNKVKFLFVLPLLSILLAASCKKDDVPKATQTGANTMAAKVNGKVWQKKACWSCSGGGSSLKVNYDDRDFFAVTGEDPDQSSKISLAISSLKSTGIFDLSSRNLNFGVLFNYGEVIYYYTSVKSIGKVTITKLDLANKIISGTFDFTAEDENNPANTIKVTDGRFDVKYN